MWILLTRDIGAKAMRKPSSPTAWRVIGHMVEFRLFLGKPGGAAPATKVGLGTNWSPDEHRRPFLLKLVNQGCRAYDLLGAGSICCARLAHN